MCGCGFVIERLARGESYFASGGIDCEEIGIVACSDGVGDGTAIGVGLTAGEGVIEIGDGGASSNVFCKGDGDITDGGVELVNVGDIDGDGGGVCARAVGFRCGDGEGVCGFGFVIERLARGESYFASG